MVLRKTIMLDENISKKITMIQAKKLRDLNQYVSYSKVINMVLEEGLKKF